MFKEGVNLLFGFLIIFPQDLQDEIEKHREMYMSLNNTGLAFLNVNNEYLSW